jgi:high-affinity Fe2+/Pb2+ permease
MRELKVRQGAIAGFVVSFVLAVALSATVMVIVTAAAINRRSQPPKAQ